MRVKQTGNLLQGAKSCKNRCWWRDGIIGVTACNIFFPFRRDCPIIPAIPKLPDELMRKGVSKIVMSTAQ